MVAGLGTVLLQAFIEVGILFVVMVAIGNVSWTAILVVPIFALMSCFAFGIGLVLGLANIRFRDVNYLVGIGLQVLFYATPIVYPLSIVPDEYRRFMELNPVGSFVYSMRQVLYTLELPTLGNWTVMVVTAAVSLVGGWVIFSRWAPTVIEEL